MEFEGGGASLISSPAGVYAPAWETQRFHVCEVIDPRPWNRVDFEPARQRASHAHGEEGGAEGARRVKNSGTETPGPGKDAEETKIDGTTRII